MMDGDKMVLSTCQKAKRTKTGCLTCRIRKVKCDEGKPACTRCTSTGRKCDGYLPQWSDVQSTPPAASLSLGIAQHKFDCEARRAIQYFQEVSAPRLSNHSSQYFWNHLVFQACYVDESIKHLVVAAAALDLQSRRTETASLVTKNTTFNSHYSRALALINQSRSLNPGTLIIACLLLVICDEFQQNQFGALQHVLAGCRIIAQHYPKERPRDSDVAVEILGPVFSHIQINTGELDREVVPDLVRWPYETAESDRYINAYSSHMPVRNPGSEGFHDLSMAATSLQSLAASCLLARPDVSPPSSLFHAVPGISTQLSWWLISFNMLCNRLAASETDANLIEIHTLRTYYITLSILSRCAPFNYEQLYDQYALKFEHICWKLDNLLACSTKPREVGPKLLIPAFAVATHYRKAAGRRRAVRNLNNCGWAGVRLATIAEQVIALEEDNGLNTALCSKIPEERRIRVIGIDFSVHEITRKTFGSLKFTKYPYDHCSDIDLRHHKFEWEGVEDLDVQESIKQLLGRVLRLDFSS